MKPEDLKHFGLVYLGTPYSKYPASYTTSGITCAFIDAAQLMGKLVKCNARNFYSPICHTHPIAIYSALNPLDHELWIAFDQVMMAKADAMVVAMMATWQESTGIKKEIEVFQSGGKPIYYLDPEKMTLSNRP